MTEQVQFLNQLAGYRQRVFQTLLETVPEDDSQPYSYGIVREVLSHAGKGLRPAICLASCGAFGGGVEDAFYSAAALEMLHNAFLLHDDVEDYSELRRNRITLRASYGAPLAVNTGDALQALAMRLLRKNADIVGPEIAWTIFEEFDHLLMRTFEGQARDLGWTRTNDFSLGPNDYVRMALGKTCWYGFIHPCRIGALVAWRGTGNLSVFSEFGFYLGVAYQIVDDLMNLNGTQEYGKEALGDLYEGKRTLMLLHLFENSNPFEKQRLTQIFSKTRLHRLPREISWVLELMQERGSINYARIIARDFLAAAKNAFGTAYANAQDNQHKQFLNNIISYVESRDSGSARPLPF